MEKMDDLITVVVPFYNGENYLEDCVKSIISQDYRNLEVILIDDGSTDKSPIIADTLKEQDNRIIVIHKKNEGVSAARNDGIKIANGKYICFTDVDDYLSKNYISYLYSLIIENNAEISLTPQPRKFNSETRNDIDDINNEEDNVKVWSGIETAKQMLYYNLVIAPWNKLISMDIIRKNNLMFDTNLAFGEGFNFSLDCFQRSKNVAVGKKKLYNYRVDNPNSVMTKFSMKMVTGSIDAQDRIQTHLVQDTKEMNKACQYARWHTYCDLYNAFLGCNVKNEYKDEYRMVKKFCKKNALCVLGAPINKKDKIKGLIYRVSPYLAASIINKLRIRKFTVENSN